MPDHHTITTMMPIKYIGKTFAEEVEILIGTLCNLPFGYIRYDESSNVLHFDSEKEGQDAFTHLKHFVFSCHQAEPALDGAKIVFVQRPTIPPTKAYLRRCDAYIRKLFKSQISNLERMLRADERTYRRRGTVFHFGDTGGVTTALECLSLDPTPSSPFGYGLLDYVQPEPLRIEITCRKDVPYDPKSI